MELLRRDWEFEEPEDGETLSQWDVGAFDANCLGKFVSQVADSGVD